MVINKLQKLEDALGETEETKETGETVEKEEIWKGFKSSQAKPVEILAHLNMGKEEVIKRCPFSN